MRKSFLVFLVGVVAGSIWLFVQNFNVLGWKDLRVAPRDGTGSKDQATYEVSTPANLSRDVIRVASYNIEVFGRSKLEKPVVMDLIVRIVQRFDLVAIQEVRSRDDDILPRFIEMLNSGGRHYDFVIGPRLGRTASKEQYAYVFDQETIEVDRNQLYTINDPGDALHREPFVGWFRARAAPPDQAFTFSLVNIHTDPDEADREVDVLDDVFNAVQNDGRREDDVIILGDFNADARHLGQFGRIPNVVPVFSSEVATNTVGTKQNDNIVFDRLAVREFTGKAGVFDIMTEFNLTLATAEEVSDHLPIWAEFSVIEGGVVGHVATRPINP